MATSTKKALQKMTEAERKAQVERALFQKRASLAEGILFNIVGRGFTWLLPKKRVSERAVGIADELMRLLFVQAEEEPKEETKDEPKEDEVYRN